MKVLFAVNNEHISDSIIKKYQQDYRELISSKNVYYFNAGWAQCLVAPDEFDAGYESVAELIKKRRNFFYKMKDRQITYTVLTRENLFSEENRNLLFTISR